MSPKHPLSKHKTQHQPKQAHHEPAPEPTAAENVEEALANLTETPTPAPVPPPPPVEPVLPPPVAAAVAEVLAMPSGGPVHVPCGTKLRTPGPEGAAFAKKNGFYSCPICGPRQPVATFKGL